MKVLINYDDNKEQSFEFNTFTFRIINGISENKLDKNFSLQIINTTGIEADFNEVAILYNLFNFEQEKLQNINNIFIYSKTEKLLFSTELLNLKLSNVVFRLSGPDEKIQSFIDMTLQKVKE